jgi:hypothetical protein
MMAKDILFGAIAPTQLIDDNGSTKTTETKIHNGQTTGPVRVRYEIRHRTKKDDLLFPSQVISDLLTDMMKLDTLIRLEKTKTGEQEGYYNLVSCYTVLEYPPL